MNKKSKLEEKKTYDKYSDNKYVVAFISVRDKYAKALKKLQD